MIPSNPLEVETYAEMPMLISLDRHGESIDGGFATLFLSIDVWEFFEDILVFTYI